MDTEIEMVRRKTDHILELDPLPLNVRSSPFFSKTMAFTVKRKLKRLHDATSVICFVTHDSDQKLVALKQIGNLIQVVYALSHIANALPDCCTAIINYGALEHLESLLSNIYNDSILLRNACMLLAALCRMKPQLPFNKREIVLRTLRFAIFIEDDRVIPQACLALSIFSKDRFVAIGERVYKRLLCLLEYKKPEIILSALRAIGNYVRWGARDQIQLIFETDVLVWLELFICHKFTEVRTESWWIISNITAVANNLKLDLCIIPVLAGLVRKANANAEFKIAAAHQATGSKLYTTGICMVKEETQIQEQDVTVANRHAVAAGGGFHSGGKFSTGFVVGYFIGRHHHHSHAVSNFCISPYYQFLATLIVLAIFILEQQL
ncbi:hypothetical protein POM88_037366 [Heracleum sosnowskyi]|uniref:Uncharacterized protein n=1 Tax=Heracleum sosnowskyi TaxID=360622 RepID=A0AAD8HQ16_9APIA|nr:hypothetical protein POM88_037366 [Heracleum sosnowskyi]